MPHFFYGSSGLLAEEPAGGRLRASDSAVFIAGRPLRRTRALCDLIRGALLMVPVPVCAAQLAVCLCSPERLPCL